MTNTTNISSLLIASSLVFLSILFSYFQKLKLEKEIIIGVIRAIVQLTIVGYLLNYIFGLNSPVFTSLLLLFMIFNAAHNISKRGKNIRNISFISFISILIATIVTLSVLVFSKSIKYNAYNIVPIGGMIISNAMVSLSLCFNKLSSDFKNKKQEIETKLALGADILISSKKIIKDSIKTGMIPTIDSTKTLGIVALPGTMTGLIIAGTSPIEAIKFQILITFMTLSTTSISSFIACYLSYSKFFNERKQLV